MSARLRPTSAPALLQEGRNCWRRVHATRVAFLVDGQDYFAAFAAAVERARHTVLIVGWDVHGDVQLHRDGRPRRRPERLGPFLNDVVGRRPGLHVYVLDWDFAMIYALERQPFPIFELGWRTHARVHFALDGTHPPGASHHQKIVVVDDEVAFVGGLDLAACRWDTREHSAADPRRVDPGHAPYPPFHDVQMAVAGPAARVLGDLVRGRWRHATGRRIRPAGPNGDPWPAGLAPALEHVPVAIARTQPAWEDRPAVHEVECLYLDAIAAAGRTIYLETQYLSSTRLGDALAARLDERDGPEVVIVSPRLCSGWLEESTMGVLRARLLARLRDADRWQRLRAFAPVVPADDGQPVDVNVHSKVLVVDDRLLRIGSSNLNNRSLRLDTECDLAIEAHDPRTARTITALRDDLVAEHLGCAPAAVADAVRSLGSLGAAIDALRGDGRTLAPLASVPSTWIEPLVPDARVIDLESPVAVEDLVQVILPRPVSHATRRNVFFGLGALSGVAVVALLDGTTPVAAWTRKLGMRVRAAEERRRPLVALGTIGAFVAGGVVLVPVNALIFVTGLIFPPRQGFIYALMGSMASAMAVFGVGKALPRDAVRLLAGPRLNRASRLLARGALEVARVRLMPAAPFSAVNLVAGASRARLRDFALGTALAMAPGIAATVNLARRYRILRRRPGAGTVLGALAATAIVPLVQVAMDRLLGEPASAPPRARNAR